jgi:nitrite reductase/ring-hydroxylating ferredoxin subunit
MGLFQRILGISKTKPPEDPESWTYNRGKVVIDWARVPELHKPCGAVRLEGRGLPDRILLIYGMDGEFHAFKNKCTHMGRRLDPGGDISMVQCCSLSKSTFDYAGNVVSGPAKGPLDVLDVENRKCKVVIRVDGTPPRHSFPSP